MKCVMVMFDSLNRRMLHPYNTSSFVKTPNFARLAQRTVTFDRSYVCSMPCMPARRDLHTGRPNFLHRSWGPLEPFDDSMPAMLGQRGVHTSLITDHYHYFEEGGATYHTKYNTWEFFRGQEGDPWRGLVGGAVMKNAHGRHNAVDRWHTQDRVNRTFIREEQQWPQAQTFSAGEQFIRRNVGADNWFVQIETFDPHEPFYSHRAYKDLYAEHYSKWREAGGLHWDWPDYDMVKESPELVEHMRHEYASLMSMCDRKLGDVLDLFDELDLWKDTMLIVWTDHGFLLGEHECWAKLWMPFYDEVAHTPFFVWDPRCGKAGERRQSLVQPSIDLPVTLLRYFGVEPTNDMIGCDLAATVANDQAVRQAAMFGIFGGQVNVTDGRYVYMRSAAREENLPLFEHTLMPTHMRGPFSVKELAGKIELAQPFTFTKGCSITRVPSRPFWGKHPDIRKTLLYDLQTDPLQQSPTQDPAVEGTMAQHLVSLMRQCDAPASQFERLGLA